MDGLTTADDDYDAGWLVLGKYYSAPDALVMTEIPEDIPAAIYLDMD